MILGRHCSVLSILNIVWSWSILTIFLWNKIWMRKYLLWRQIRFNLFNFIVMWRWIRSHLCEELLKLLFLSHLRSLIKWNHLVWMLGQKAFRISCLSWLLHQLLMLQCSCRLLFWSIKLLIRIFIILINFKIGIRIFTLLYLRLQISVTSLRPISHLIYPDLLIK